MKTEVQNRRLLDREILRLSVPAVITNITVPLLGLCDTVISGHLGEVRFLGAIAAGSVMINSLFWLFGFLRMGSSGLTAQAYGAGSHDRVRGIFWQATLLGLLIGFTLLACNKPLCGFLLGVISPSGDVSELARSYFSIAIAGAPAILATSAVTGWMIGMQNTVRPMAVAISVNVLNILLSLLFTVVMRYGFTGIAWGTCIANWAGLALAIILALRIAPDRKLLCPWRLIWDSKTIKPFFKVNTDIFLRSACIMAVTVTVTAVGARLGSLTLATNAVMLQFFHIFSYFMDGIAFTGEALCGKFLGSGNRAMLRFSVNRLLLWGGVVSFLFFIVYLCLHNVFIGLITSEKEVVQAAAGYSIWIILIPLASGGAFIYDGVFIGITATRQMLAATAIAALVFFAVLFCNILSPDKIHPLDNNRLWAGFLAYLFFRGAVLATFTLFMRQFKKVNAAVQK